MSALIYQDADGEFQGISGCDLHEDDRGRFWLWNEYLGRNLAYKITGKEDALLAAIDSLLFTIKLRDERIEKLQRVADLAHEFSNLLGREDGVAKD